MAKLSGSLIKFMQLKARVLEYPGYFTEEDEEEIRGWPAEEIERIWEYIDTEPSPDDADLCPFCVHFEGACDECTYGEIHGICKSTRLDNTYGRMLHELEAGSIVEYLEGQSVDPYELWKEANKE